LKQLVFAALLATCLVARAQQQQELGQLDASPTLFTVMAAINAAGYDTDLASPNNHPLRAAIRAELAKRNIPSLAALKDFFAQHHLRTGTAELGQYISFALTAEGPPDFGIHKRDVEIPPDVATLEGFSTLLAAFYKEADIPDLWRRSQPAINQYLERYHKPVIDTVLQVNAYMRQQTSGVKGRRFQILIDLQAQPGQVQRRSYGYTDTVVVTPSPEIQIFDIRHAYLHYLLDPLANRYQEILDRKKGLIDHAQRAETLDDSFKEDFLQLASECLIKAVETRLDHQPEKVEQALLEGFILTPYFAEHLALYEKQEQSMQEYYPEMVGGIDLYKQDAFLSKVHFNRPGAQSAPAPPPPPPLTGAAKTLDDAEQLYLARDRDQANLEKAKKLYQQVLEQTDQKPLHAAAYYGLARIAILSRNPEDADRLLRKSLESGPGPDVKPWVLIYLGRLEMAAGERDQAVQFFQNALQVEGASDKAREEAKKSLEASSKQ
jgi:tetratricopeptide (TPR) repeat protein